MAVDKVTELIVIFCPACGHKFSHEKKAAGKALGAVGGAIAGAKVGAGVGLVGGPLGAIAGTIPAPLLGFSSVIKRGAHLLTIRSALNAA